MKTELRVSMSLCLHICAENSGKNREMKVSKAREHLFPCFPAKYEYILKYFVNFF
jgi:hypothetical protein